MKYVAIALLLINSCLLIFQTDENVELKQRINYLESELKSVRYHYLKCSSALLDSTLHEKCFRIKD